MTNGYVPFPAFSEWAMKANGFHAFERAAQQFSSFAEQQRERYQKQATRSASVDSNAIEGVFTSDRGFTYTVATMAHGWESRVSEKGVHARPAFEAAMDGYNMVLDIATGAARLTESFIRELHAVMLSSQDEFVVHTVAGSQRQALPKGVYKTQPNRPTKPNGEVHYYASPDDTPSEMHRLVEQCTGEEFVNAHPALQASYIHYGFVCIHPFADGNGRVARALASAYLYRRPGLPLVIFDDQKLQYFDALEAADAGNYRPFIDFIESRVVDSMQDAIAELDDDDSGVEALLTELDSTHAHDPLASRLADATFTAFENHATPLIESAAIETTVLRNGNLLSDLRDGYSPAIPSDEAFTLLLSTPSSDPKVLLNVGVYKGSDGLGAPEYKVIAHATIPQASQPVTSHFVRDLEVYQRELYPALTSSLHNRIDRWTKHLLKASLEAFRNS